MNLDEAKIVLAKAINQWGEIDCLKPFLMWKPGADRIHLDGKFTVRQLEAMVVIMKSGPLT